MFCAPDSGNTEAYIKRSRPLAGDLAITQTHVRTVFVAPAPGLPLLNPEAAMLPRGGPLPLPFVITHDVPQGRREACQHGLYEPESSEFRARLRRRTPGARDDRERERRSPTTTSRRTTRPSPSSRTRRGRQLARSTAKSWPLVKSTCEREAFVKKGPAAECWVLFE